MICEWHDLIEYELQIHTQTELSWWLLGIFAFRFLLLAQSLIHYREHLKDKLVLANIIAHLKHCEELWWFTVALSDLIVGFGVED